MVKSQNYFRVEWMKVLTPSCERPNRKIQKARQQLGEKTVHFIFELAISHADEVFTQRKTLL